MDRFVKGKRKAIDEVAQTQAGAVHSKAKCGKYDRAYAFLLSASLTAQLTIFGSQNILGTLVFLVYSCVPLSHSSQGVSR